MNWWNRLWHREQMEEQLEKEMQFHLQQHANDLIARGHDPEEARRQARLDLGGPEQVKEKCRDARGTRWVDTLAMDVRYAIRALRSSPGIAAVAILSLALGIGANTAIFSLIGAVILKTLPVSHPEQLLQVTMGRQAYFTNPIWEQVRDRQDVFSGIFTYGGQRFNLAAGGEARYALGNYASGQFFETLGLHTLLGRSFTAADDQRGCPGTVLLGYGFWQKEYAGHADVVGKTLSLDNHPFEILGFWSRGLTGLTLAIRPRFTCPFALRRSFTVRLACWISVARRGYASSAARSPAFRPAWQKRG
jgi:putative ABC transport system permease protein